MLRVFRVVKAVLTVILRTSHDRLLRYKCEGGMTALHMAAACRNKVLLRMLAEAGVEMFALDDSGRNIAHYVATTLESGHDGTVSEPVDALHADAHQCARWVVSAAPELLDMRDTAGNTPLHCAAQYGCVFSCMRSCCRC